MATAAPHRLRIPLVLLAAADLALLAVRLQPWPAIANLPGQGATGYDPLICLAAYVLLLFWIAGIRNEGMQKGLVAGFWLGLPGGLLLVGQVLVARWPSPQAPYVSAALMGVAGLLWGAAGVRAARMSGNPASGIVAGAWSAMVSALIGCAAIVAEMGFAAPVAGSQDPWKQYQALAIGDEALQYLVHSLNMVTGFLLIGPIVGAMLGLVFAVIGQKN